MEDVLLIRMLKEREALQEEGAPDMEKEPLKEALSEEPDISRYFKYEIPAMDSYSNLLPGMPKDI